MPLVVNDDLLGLLIAEGSDAVDLARAAANQIGVAIKKIEVIEELLEKNLIRDFFEQLASRHPTGGAGARAERLGCDLDRPHVVLIAAAADERLERRLKAVVPGGADRPPRRRAARAAAGRLRRQRAPARGTAQAPRGRSPTLRRSGSRTPAPGRRATRAGSRRRATRWSGPPCSSNGRRSSATTTSASISTCCGWRSTRACATPQRDALTLLLVYDQEHGTALLATLEQFLLRRGNISATSEALYIHPNTLRQRLRRIAELTGIDLARDDWLMLELALKLLKLQRVLGDDAHIRDARGM